MANALIKRYVQNVVKTQKTIAAVNRAFTTVLSETKVYIGLNDADTKRQEHDTSSYISVLKRVCVEHGVPFSFDVINGGYIHDDGEYTEENTIVLTFIDVEKEIIDEIAQDLCADFHQESVLITTGPVHVRMIRGVSDDESDA
ncbi:MAG: hypothetical protein J6D34_01950 [Atopobiaceae bacterium]|nr:hypothetical protein [Atopobiaceae bacterium]